MSNRGVSQAAFLTGHGKLLGMFANTEDVDAITVASGHYETVAVQVKRVVESSVTGKSVFKSDWLQASRAMFQATIMERLMNLEHLISWRTSSAPSRIR